MPDLITRLETAERGSRELSDEFLLAAGFQRKGKSVDFEGGPVGLGRWWYGPDGTKYGFDPDPTVNLQDAVDCVPEGWQGGVFFSNGLPLSDQAGLQRGEPPYFDSEEIDVQAASPALALCAAILRAKERG